MLGSILIDSYTKTPIRNYGDTRFADIRQTEEAYAIVSDAPCLQYLTSGLLIINFVPSMVYMYSCFFFRLKKIFFSSDRKTLHQLTSTA